MTISGHSVAGVFDASKTRYEKTEEENHCTWLTGVPYCFVVVVQLRSLEEEGLYIVCMTKG